MNASSTQHTMNAVVRQAPDQKDQRGLRVVRHAGPGVSIVSRVDARGRLLRQDLVLGDEVISWQHGTRVRTGLQTGAGEGEALYDVQPSRRRLDHARQAVDGYTGQDKYVRHLARVVLLSAGLGGAELVTRALGDRLRQRLPARRSPAVFIAALAVVTFGLVFLAVRLLHHVRP